MASSEEPSSTPASPHRRPSQSSTIVVTVGGSFAQADVSRLCEHVRVLLEAEGAGRIVCDVSALVDPDADTIDALARLQLTALRFGGRVALRHASRELRELLALMGLSDVMPHCAELRLEPGGQTEEREQRRGIEEEADSRDPAG